MTSGTTSTPRSRSLSSVRAFKNEPRTDLVRIAFVYLPLQCSGHQNIALNAPKLITIGDMLPACEARHAAVRRDVGLQGADFQP